ncbi:MAG: TPM domain-containing protein [Bacteroidales bacterium]|jgi:uncharacterized membrane protein|nr:TPM domain-containing protein [Bacteroidales bacterium]
MKASEFFTREQQERIRSAIKEAELDTSGEIRVHLETSVSGDVLDRAAWIFAKVGMHKTENRNGVLIYLAVGNKKFAVIGDTGINSKVPGDFWDRTRELIQSKFREEKYTEGIVEGILMAGQQLKEFFPHKRDDVNELPDDISYNIPE